MIINSDTDLFMNMIPLNHDKILSSPIIIYAYGRAACFYNIKPQLVLRPGSLHDIKQIFQYSAHNKRHITFRAAGTSLSGQALGDDIIVDISGAWDDISIEADGKLVRVGPGIRGGKINEYLKPYGRIIGPDPASLNACMAGGILANNSSGMCSGIEKNPYNTFKTMKFILPEGLLIDTEDRDASRILMSKSPDIFNGIMEIKQEIESDTQLINKIISKYKIKNTIGYSLNAFIDYDNPVDILSHLMIGSEGTLGFIAEAVFETFPDYPNNYTGLLFFPDMKSACDAIAPLKATGTNALEILDGTSLKSVENKPGAPEIIKHLDSNAAAILFEYSVENAEVLNKIKSDADAVIKKLNLLKPESPVFSNKYIAQSNLEREQIWSIRKGLLTSLSSTRAKGSTVVIEDLAFAIEDIPEAVRRLHELFEKHGYKNTGVYGHGNDGNIHFMISQPFENQSDINRYDAFMKDIADLTVSKFNASLKAEHGTGRNMAPFVKKEWGEKAHDIMKRIKKLIDPQNILNPGVLLNDDDKIHLKNIKSIPEVNSLIDDCIECGFCEAVCPSRKLTLTPRKRIALQREMLNSNNPHGVIEQIKKDYQYFGIETCAVDGLCETVCPVNINTGSFIKLLRANKHSRHEQKTAHHLSNHFNLMQLSVKIALTGGHLIQDIAGTKLIHSITKTIDNKTNIAFPKWNGYLNKPVIFEPKSMVNIDAVYFPCCISRMMGRENGTDDNIIDTLLYILEKAGIKAGIPKDINNYCCGTVFSSKGYTEAYRNILAKTVNSMWEWSREGSIPVILDSSSCAYSMKTCSDYLDKKTKQKWENLKILDSIEFIYDNVINRLKISALNESVVLHNNCSVRKMELEAKLKAIAEKCAERVIIPVNTECCAFAGDRGLLYPELTASALKAEQKELSSVKANGYYSSNIPCEAGLSSTSGKKYQSYLYLIKKALEFKE